MFGIFSVTVAKVEVLFNRTFVGKILNIPIKKRILKLVYLTETMRQALTPFINYHSQIKHQAC